MIERLSKRITKKESQGGFTLIELLVVVIIIAILLAIAIPSYLSFRERAQKAAAQANVRAAIPAVEAFYADTGSYTSISLAALQSIDAGVKHVSVSSTGPATYCIQNTSPTSHTFSKNGPSADIVEAAC